METPIVEKSDATLGEASSIYENIFSSPIIIGVLVVIILMVIYFVIFGTPSFSSTKEGHGNKSGEKTDDKKKSRAKKLVKIIEKKQKTNIGKSKVSFEKGDDSDSDSDSD
jgi:hypothetical protein